MGSCGRARVCTRGRCRTGVRAHRCVCACVSTRAPRASGHGSAAVCVDVLAHGSPGSPGVHPHAPVLVWEARAPGGAEGQVAEGITQGLRNGEGVWHCSVSLGHLHLKRARLAGRDAAEGPAPAGVGEEGRGRGKGA